MSELISGKEAKLAWANDKTVQIRNIIVGEDFYDLTGDNAQLGVFDIAFYQFRLKPQTITLNGVEVECLRSSEWSQSRPNKVTLEFKSKQAAMFFRSKALEIFNDIK